MSFLQSFYWKSPYFMKCWMACLHARREDVRRHGKMFEDACRQIRSRNGWTPEQFGDYQKTELEKILVHASANVPYYSELLDKIKARFN